MPDLEAIMVLVDAYADAKTVEHDAGNRPHLYDESDEELENRVDAARLTLLQALTELRSHDR